MFLSGFLDASIVTIESNLLFGLIGNLALLLSLQVTERIQVFFLNWIYPIDDVPIYHLCAWWAREGSGINITIVGLEYVHELAEWQLSHSYFINWCASCIDVQTT